MYDENFKYVSPDSEDGKRFIEEGIGNYLFYWSNDIKHKLYIHLARERNKTFSCKYEQIDSVGIQYVYNIIEIKTEEDLQSESVDCNCPSIFFNLRCYQSLQYEGWVERHGKMPNEEEKEFLKKVDKEV